MSNILNERQTRANVLKVARELKCEQDVLQIFAKWDKLLIRETNPQIKEMIALAANEEIHFFLNSRPGFLLVGNKIIGKE